MSNPIRSLVDNLTNPVKPYLHAVWIGLVVIILLYIVLKILTHLEQSIILHVRKKPGINRDCCFSWLEIEDVRNAIEECKMAEEKQAQKSKRSSL